jgi:hypothetical protein
MPTIEVPVAASTDDCRVHWSGSAWSLTTVITDQLVGCPNASTIYKVGGGMRFLNINIPVGATIEEAHLIFTCSNSRSAVTVNTIIIGEKSASPDTFSDIANYQSRRGTIVNGANDDNITSHSVYWDNIGAWSYNHAYNSPDIKDIIQEIVNLPDWKGDGTDRIVLFWDDHAGRGTQSNDIQRIAASYDNSNLAEPVLHIEYSAGGGTAKTSAETGSGAEGLLLNAAAQRTEIAGGIDARQSLLASLIKSDGGSGVEQSLRTSYVAKLSADIGSGLEIRNLVVRLISGEGGHGVDTGAIPGQKSVIDEDGGLGYDALKVLIETSGAVSDMKLPGRQGHVKIPSKGVSL